nr:MFS transporter [Beijerinckia indica]
MRATTPSAPQVDMSASQIIEQPMDRRPFWIALLVAAAFFMENLDGTVIATALPQMAHTFGIEPVELDIGMSAYLLTLGVFVPISGWVADRFGDHPFHDCLHVMRCEQ